MDGRGFVGLVSPMWTCAVGLVRILGFGLSSRIEGDGPVPLFVDLTEQYRWFVAIG